MALVSTPSEVHLCETSAEPTPENQPYYVVLLVIVNCLGNQPHYVVLLDVICCLHCGGLWTAVISIH